MKRDISITEGDMHKPAVILIHGLGMDRRIWESPDEARILGGRFPIKVLLCKGLPPCSSILKSPRLSLGSPPEKLATIFHDLKAQGYTVITYSQQRPSAGVEVALRELEEIVSSHAGYLKAGIILIGHSRGGLVARKYLASGDRRARGLITLATPHKGSRMAQWAGYAAPAAAIIKAMLPDAEKGTLIYAVKRTFEFLSGRAVNELLPASDFFKALADKKPAGVSCISMGGKDPSLFTVYRMYSEKAQGGFISRQEKVFSFPEILERLIPEKLLPEEIKKGCGDGLVSAESSALSYADEHIDFEVNHAGILFDEKARAKLMDIVKQIS